MYSFDFSFSVLNFSRFIFYLVHYHLSFLSVSSIFLLKILCFILKADPQAALSFCYQNSLYLRVASILPLHVVLLAQVGAVLIVYIVLAFPEGFPLTALAEFRLS